MFVDSSAIVAILTEEEDWRALFHKLEAATQRFTSPICIFESGLALPRKRDMATVQASQFIERFLADYSIETTALTKEMSLKALEIFALYGKGSGHAAQLNMGDCLIYASAVFMRQKLLFKGNDFIHTPIEIA